MFRYPSVLFLSLRQSSKQLASCLDSHGLVCLVLRWAYNTTFKTYPTLTDFGTDSKHKLSTRAMRVALVVELRANSYFFPSPSL